MDQQFYEQKHTTTISSDRFKSDNSQPFNLLGSRSCKSPNGTDVSGIGVAVDGRLANRRQKETLPVIVGGDVENCVGALFFEGEEMGTLKFSSSEKGQKAQRDVARGDLQIFVKNLHTSKGSQPACLSLEPSEKRESDEPMEQTQIIQTANPIADLSPNAHNFSLGRAIRAEMEGDWSEAGYEREMCQEAKRNYAGSAKGLVVPFNSVFSRATMVTSGDVSGGIGTSHISDRYIDIPRAASSVLEAGATIIQGLNSNVAIPKNNSDVSASFIAENSAITESDIDIDTITMSPRMVAGTSSFSRHVLATAQPTIDELVREGLQKQITNRIDSSALTGDGSGANPTGVTATTGINTKVTAGNSTMTHAESLEIIAAVAANNLDASGGVFIIHPNDAATIGATSKDSGSGTFVYENGLISGKRVIESTHAPQGTAFFGIFRHLYIGFFGGVDLVIDPYTSARNGVVEITATQLVDIAVAYEKAFNKITLTA